MSIGIDYGSGMIALSDAEIEKENRLFTLKQVHQKWKAKQEGSEKPNNQEEMEMAKKKGTCEQCGKENMGLGSSHGKECCSSCMNFRSAVNSRPEVVAAIYSEFHGSLQGGHATQKYDELQEQNQSLSDFNNELVTSTGVWESFYKGLMEVVLPAVDPAALDFYEYRDGLSGVIQAKLELAGEEPDASAAVEKISTLLGLEGASLASVFETVEVHIASMKYYQEQSTRLRETLEDRERQISELTRIVTASDPKADRREQVLDIALAVIRDEGHVVADKLEMLRHGVV